MNASGRRALLPQGNRSPVRILVIEDDVAVTRVVERSLAMVGFEVVSADKGAVGVETAREVIPDLIICDIGMPEMDGHAVLQELRAEDKTRHIPFIFLTGSSARHDIRRGMSMGADDYLTKPFMPKDLIEAVQARIARREQISDGLQGKLSNMLQNVAPNFDVAGRSNQSLIPDRSVMELQVAAECLGVGNDRFGERCVSVLRPMDSVGDCCRLGHVAMEALQLHIERRIVDAVKARDIDCWPCRLVGFGRYGLLFGAEVDLEAAQQAVSSIARSLRAAYWVQSTEVFLRFSAGVSMGSLLDPEDADVEDVPARFERLLLQAETAARKSDRMPAGQVSVFDGDLPSSAMHGLRMEADLRRSISRNELRLHYQPQVELASDAVVGFEALVRWQHQELGLVSPAHFIPMAEESGFIIDIGEWVLREACRQISEWRNQGYPVGRVAVNISAVQLQSIDLAALVRSVLREYSLHPCHLQLELTETVILSDFERASQLIYDLREMGVSVAIDDFGTGHSTLAYLSRLTFDELKIDRSFVKGMEYHGERMAIVETILVLSEKLGFSVTAEGIENDAARDLLTKHRCQYGQGYHFAPPMTPDVVETVMRSRRPGMIVLASDLRGVLAANRRPPDCKHTESAVTSTQGYAVPVADTYSIETPFQLIRSMPQPGLAKGPEVASGADAGRARGQSAS